MACYRQQIESFNRRWNIAIDGDKEFERFKNRILAAVDQAVGEFVLRHPSVSRKLAVLVGARLPAQSRVDPLPGRQLAEVFSPRLFDQTATYKVLEAACTENELIFSLQCLFWALAEARCPELERLVELVRIAANASPLVSMRIAQRGDRVILYPAGAKLLDDRTVNDVLAWLKDHQPVAKEFEKTLKTYLTKDKTQYRNLLDDLRLALEKLLRRVLGNKKSLENQQNDLGAWLKRKRAHRQIANMYWQLLDRFSTYQNDVVKHKAERTVTEPEVEFMIYLTGTFMRFLLRLS